MGVVAYWGVGMIEKHVSEHPDQPFHHLNIDPVTKSLNNERIRNKKLKGKLKTKAKKKSKGNAKENDTGLNLFKTGPVKKEQMIGESDEDDEEVIVVVRKRKKKAVGAIAQAKTNTNTNAVSKEH